MTLVVGSSIVIQADTQPNEVSILQITETTFVSLWDTTLVSRNPSESSEPNQIKLPLDQDGTYNFTVDWGDGHTSTIKAWNQDEHSIHMFLKDSTKF